eukprot:TRINITY_DN6285_c0_g1_i1.p2 TRINITY_DN6285_c0_g1~~TRINITY_DN6285_c0_g1_i1.p2  ORF type:complete len:57 (+),score=10.59 TRINITY_DN6285_c0_g1_i1:194-364(+)
MSVGACCDMEPCIGRGRHDSNIGQVELQVKIASSQQEDSECLLDVTTVKHLWWMEV